jgi:hypothetical protein
MALLMHKPAHGVRSSGILHRPPQLFEVRKDGFRVVVSNECGLDNSYATLSHCWGNAPDFLKLTTANIERQRQ